MPFTDYPNAYLGIVAVVLLLPALLAWPAGWRRTPHGGPPRVFVALLAVLALLVAFGGHFPLYRLLYDHLPLFNKFRVPVMILLLLQVAMALGAAWGWSAVLERGGAKDARGPRLNRVLLGTAAVIAVVLLVGLLARDAWHDQYVKRALDLKGRSLRFGQQPFGAQEAAAAWMECYGSFIRAAILALGTMVIAWIARGGRFRAVASGALLALLLIELWPVSARVMSPVIGERVAVPQDVGRDDTIEFLEKAGPPGSFRILPLDEFQSNRFATFGIASLGGYHAAKPQLVQDMFTHRLQDNAYWMQLLNIRYVVSVEPYQQLPPMLRVVHNGAAQVLEFGAALPRVTVVGEYRVLSPPQAILDSVASGRFNSATLTFLEEDPRLTLGPVEGASATIDSYRLNDVAITVDTPGPGLVRLADLWYPDWVATVDGRPARILKADYLLRAVAVPAGRHRVEFHYRSKAVRHGLVLSIVSLIVVLAGIGWASLGGWKRAGTGPGPVAEA
jgi:hypothetical protein